MNWYLKAMNSYATFKGRSTRSEYWYFMLFYILILVMPLILAGFLGLGENGQSIMFIISGILLLIHIIPSLAVSIRRLHDIDKSGWWYLISFIPYIGAIAIMIMAMIDSKDDNEYGENPKT